MRTPLVIGVIAVVSGRRSFLSRALRTSGPERSSLKSISPSDPARDGFLLIRPRSVDHLFECDIFLALGAADQTDLFKVVLGLEQVALFGMPHAVIGPGQSVVGIGVECLVAYQYLASS